MEPQRVFGGAAKLFSKAFENDERGELSSSCTLTPGSATY